MRRGSPVESWVNFFLLTHLVKHNFQRQLCKSCCKVFTSICNDWPGSLCHWVSGFIFTAACSEQGKINKSVNPQDIKTLFAESAWKLSKAKELIMCLLFSATQCLTPGLNATRDLIKTGEKKRQRTNFLEETVCPTTVHLIDTQATVWFISPKNESCTGHKWQRLAQSPLTQVPSGAG